jgi:hypothetical protein
MHLQTSKSLNTVKLDMIPIPKIVDAQHYCASNGKMKV